MKNKIKAILFDIDDTLYDRNKAQYLVVDKIVQRIPQAFGGIPKERVLEAFLESDRISTIEWDAGRHNDDIRDYRSILFLNLLQVSTEWAGAVTDAYIQEYPFINAPVDGAVELVVKVSHSFKTGVISNSLPDVQYQKIETLGLRPYFSCVVLAMEIGMKKPDPAIFRYAARQLGVKPEDCMYIGDSYNNDIVGAKGAGMRAGWLMRNNTYPDGAKIKADITAKSCKEMALLQEVL